MQSTPEHMFPLITSWFRYCVLRNYSWHLLKYGVAECALRDAYAYARMEQHAFLAQSAHTETPSERKEVTVL